MIKHFYERETGRYLGQFKEGYEPSGARGVKDGPRHAMERREGGQWVSTPELERQEAAEGLQGSDMEIVRTVEDLRDLLIEKGLLAESDFHPAVNEKFNRRKTLRQKMKTGA